MAHRNKHLFLTHGSASSCGFAALGFWLQVGFWSAPYIPSGYSRPVLMASGRSAKEAKPNPANTTKASAVMPLAKSVRVGTYSLPTVNPGNGREGRKNWEQIIHSSTLPLLLRNQPCDFNVFSRSTDYIVICSVAPVRSLGYKRSSRLGRKEHLFSFRYIEFELTMG